MYAIVETGSKQYKVSEGDVIKVEKLAVEVGQSYDLNNVIFIADDKTNNVKVSATSYSNQNSGWLSSSVYTSGIVYEVKASDSLHFDSWKWETNDANKAVDSSITIDSNSNNYSMQHADAKQGNSSDTNCGEKECSFIKILLNMMKMRLMNWKEI